MLKVDLFSLSLLGYTQSTYLYYAVNGLLFLFDRSWCVSHILLIPLTFAILCLKVSKFMFDDANIRSTFTFIVEKKNSFFRQFKTIFFSRNFHKFSHFKKIKSILSLFNLFQLPYVAAPSRIQCDNYGLTFAEGLFQIWQFTEAICHAPFFSVVTQSQMYERRREGKKKREKNFGTKCLEIKTNQMSMYLIVSFCVDCFFVRIIDRC